MTQDTKIRKVESKAPHAAAVQYQPGFGNHFCVPKPFRGRFRSAATRRSGRRTGSTRS